MQAKTVTAVVVSAVVFAIGGWIVGSKSGTVHIAKHSHKEKDCKNKECKIDIVVVCDDPAHPTPDTCESYADDAEVIMVDSKTPPLEFKIKTGSFEFIAADGIAFSTLNAGDTHFDCKPDASDPKKKFLCTPKDLTVPALYKYSIDIDKAGKTDPWVVNY
jgi:hypothetical protein